VNADAKAFDTGDTSQNAARDRFMSYLSLAPSQLGASESFSRLTFHE
jgi:hypothetical protein